MCHPQMRNLCGILSGKKRLLALDSGVLELRTLQCLPESCNDRCSYGVYNTIRSPPMSRTIVVYITLREVFVARFVSKVVRRLQDSNGQQ